MSFLSHTAKMACPGFNLPIGKGCPAMAQCIASEPPGRTAICRRCYAGKGRYVFRQAKDVMERRWQWWQKTEPVERGHILAAFVLAEGEPRYFRCYDSGDLDLTAEPTWLTLVERLPNTVFWIPTRNWLLPEYLPMLRRLNQHPRIVVRPSAVLFGDLPPVVEGLSAGITAPEKHQPQTEVADYACPGQCGECRVCWNSPEVSVAYEYK